MSWLDEIATPGGPMTFEHGATVHRQRAKTIRDPYSDTDVEADWDDPDELPIPGAFLAQSSTTVLNTATRTQQLESKSLYCDPAADVREGDRIRVGTDIYTIDGIPAADENPFTGWMPAREIPLTRAIG